MFALTGISENLAFSTLGEMSAVARQEHLDAKRRYRKLDRTYPLTRAVSMGRFGKIREDSGRKIRDRRDVSTGRPSESSSRDSCRPVLAKQ